MDPDIRRLLVGSTGDYPSSMSPGNITPDCYEMFKRDSVLDEYIRRSESVTEKVVIDPLNIDSDNDDDIEDVLKSKGKIDPTSKDKELSFVEGGYVKDQSIDHEKLLTHKSEGSDNDYLQKLQNSNSVSREKTDQG